MTDQEKINGIVEHITYYNEDSGWGVVRIMPEGKYPQAQANDGTLAVVGIMPQLVEGESVELTGKWVENAQYGLQFKAEQVIPKPPTNRQGIISYLADTVVGVGTKTAEKIYDYFGDDTMTVLDNNPERIHDVPGLKPQLAEKVIETWRVNRGYRQLMIHLQSFGVTSRMASRIIKTFDEQALHVVQKEPYRLATEMYGVGFKKADAIALASGFPPDAIERMQAALHNALERQANNGHTYYPRPLLLDETFKLLGLNEDDILRNRLIEALDREIAEGNLRQQFLHHQGEVIDAIYLRQYYYAERKATELLRRMATEPSGIIAHMTGTDWPAYLSQLSEHHNVKLSDQQQSAVKAVMTNKISVLTGGPGTGKTTTLRMVIEALEAEHYDYKLASPTGRASKRLAEATNRPAMTIHRLLGWDPMSQHFLYNEDEPFDTQVLIIDESSMVDLLLFQGILRALLPTTHLMLVGDVDQLPSVGAGNVLRDVIDSGIAHVTRLDRIFRQDAQSHITLNAHRINHGQMPVMDNQSKDFFFFRVPDPQETEEMTISIVTQRLRKKFVDANYDLMNDVQVIAPMYRGPSGVNALNKALQAALNPKRPRVAEIVLGGRTFRAGDKVMQTRNNYEKNVFNGDIGFVHAISRDDRIIQILMDNRFIDYEFDDAEEQLIHAFCISTHRSQGSEYPVVVMPVLTQHHIMLQRNLLYTAITRAKQIAVLVGNPKAVSIAVKNNKVTERYTGLLPRLLG